MKDFVEGFIDNTFKEFQGSIEELGCLCNLKGWFDEHEAPDYNLPIVQNLYYLKYFHAYVTEYYSLYSTISKNNYLDDEFRVLSIGCGGALDYYSLYFYLKNKGILGDDRNYYKGIDVIDWNHKTSFDDFPLSFQCADIGAFKRLRGLYNLVLFPKSLSELPDDVFCRMSDSILKTEFESDTLCLAASYRLLTDRYARARLEDMAHKLSKEQGYEINRESMCTWHFPKSKKLSREYPNFFYECKSNIIGYLLELRDKCPAYLEEECSGDRYCKKLNRYPMLNSDFVSHEIIQLNR